jgi:hypothetical protein
MGFRLKVFVLALLVGCTAAVAIDLDHPLSFALGISDGRFLHLPVLLILGAAWALCGGLLVIMGVLKHEKNNWKIAVPRRCGKMPPLGQGNEIPTQVLL